MKGKKGFELLQEGKRLSSGRRKEKKTAWGLPTKTTQVSINGREVRTSQSSKAKENRKGKGTKKSESGSRSDQENPSKSLFEYQHTKGRLGEKEGAIKKKEGWDR